MNRNLITIKPVPKTAKGLWMPVIGAETLDFLSTIKVPEDSKNSIRDAAVSIIAKSVPPTGQTGQETGLVVGYVQSGKTMCFEAVTTLAHDNGFQIVIIVAGMAKPLLDQLKVRLNHDLRLDEPNRPRRWLIYQNPSIDDETIKSIRNGLALLRDPNALENFKKTILITVLKNHQHLQNLTKLIQALTVKGVPVLIIDDEADQASLNYGISKGQDSTTYRCIMELRKAIPTHTYLQYTATPQAPLLVSIIDSLSPNFVQVLEPGGEYVGGREFFANNCCYTRVIPPQDVPTKAVPLNEPPVSLMKALRIFMVGVTAGVIQIPNTGNRSMLVHPSHLKDQHHKYYNWVRDIFDNWVSILGLPDNEPDKQELIEDFLEAYKDLTKTVGGNLPIFDKLIPSFRHAFLSTRVLEVNTRKGSTPLIDWRGAYGWILVGGQSMDRGFTVEGLTVTYMPRGVGVGNADTVQQRARFFGYKRSYLGYCRAYLEQSTLYAFQNYVEHEEDIRAQLEKFQQSGQSLNKWKRVFVLDKGLKPCRHNVLEFYYKRGCFSNSWVIPQVIYSSDAIVQSNQQTVDNFISGLTFHEDDGHMERTPYQSHYVCRDISLQEVIKQLLVDFRIMGSNDSQRNTGMLLQLSKNLENGPSEVCTIYRMSPKKGRNRSIDKNGEVSNLFQGEAPVHPIKNRGKVYPGDRAIRDIENVTVQIHILNLMCDKCEVAQKVPVLAVWVPARYAYDWIVQDQT